MAAEVQLHYANMMAKTLGPRQGLKLADLHALRPRLAQAHRALQLARAAGQLPFYDLPYAKPQLGEIKALAQAARNRFDALVVLGIGGSALGNLCLHAALNHPYHNELPAKARRGFPRIYVPDNVDPDRMQALLDLLDLRRCLINVITKSGNTAETMAQFMVLYKRLEQAVGRKRLAQHLVVTTDPQKGDLRAIARKLGLLTFAVPEGVGGRFSVLSPGGLLSAAISGIDVDALLAGASAMDRRCRQAEVWRNPAMLFAALLYLADRKQGKHIHVMMPYSNRLYLLADWFRQLWAESLGKRFNRRGRAVYTGPTPIKALGATDQHSQLQLYTEGPFDKVVCFLRVKKFDRDIQIPKLFPKHSGIAYLGGKSLGKLLNAEQTATEGALTRTGRANLRLDVPAVDAPSFGELIYLLECATAYAGELYNINAFDQPGVEVGKQITCALLGKPGFHFHLKRTAT